MLKCRQKSMIIESIRWIKTKDEGVSIYEGKTSSVTGNPSRSKSTWTSLWSPQWYSSRTRRICFGWIREKRLSIWKFLFFDCYSVFIHDIPPAQKSNFLGGISCNGWFNLCLILLPLEYFWGFPPLLVLEEIPYIGDSETWFNEAIMRIHNLW